ncbi:MAG TPA: hypothetical protein VGA86_03530, partial [Desulfatiglandales bacterium]
NLQASPRALFAGISVEEERGGERDSRDKEDIGEWSAKVKIRLDIFVDTGSGGCYLFSMKVRVLE